MHLSRYLFHHFIYLCEMVETHEDNGGEDEDGGGDEEEDVAEVEELLVAGGALAPGPQGHHARASHQRHPDSSLSSGHETNKICKHSTLILDVRKWRWLVCWCWVGHFSFPPNPDWFLSTSSPAQPSPALPNTACCCLLPSPLCPGSHGPVSGVGIQCTHYLHYLHYLHSPLKVCHYCCLSASQSFMSALFTVAE